MQKHIIKHNSADMVLIIDVNYANHIIGINYQMDVNSELSAETLKADISLSNWVISQLPFRIFFNESEKEWLINRIIQAIQDYTNHFIDPAHCAGFRTEYSIILSEI